MDIVIRGHNLPGRMFRSVGVPIHNVHVGLQMGRVPLDLIPGDAASAEWRVDVRVETEDDTLDFKGAAVHGRRGGRFLCLLWGDVDQAGGFSMFRSAKLMLDKIDPELIRQALAGQCPLDASIDLTDGYGGPRSGRVEHPSLRWTI